MDVAYGVNSESRKSASLSLCNLNKHKDLGLAGARERAAYIVTAAPQRRDLHRVAKRKYNLEEF